MKKVTLDEICGEHSFFSYDELYQYIVEQIGAGNLKPIKNSKTNGKKPALYNCYWRNTTEIIENEQELLEEISFKLFVAFDGTYYKKNLDKYLQNRDMICAFSNYLTRQKESLLTEMSMNERSFDIFCREKFLSEEKGKEVLRRLKYDLNNLAFYNTSEPLAYYSHHKKIPQNILIIENKDTFYSMRKYMGNGYDKILGMSIGTLIYGGGKAVLKSFEDYVGGAENYFDCADNQIYYFGDLDYEGIQIYESLSEKYKDSVKIQVFQAGYEKMFEKARRKGLSRMPMTKEGQTEKAGSRFYSYFDSKTIGNFVEFLKSRRYIPQEILNVGDFSLDKEMGM